jgi:hypothetical protein
MKVDLPREVAATSRTAPLASAPSPLILRRNQAQGQPAFRRKTMTMTMTMTMMTTMTMMMKVERRDQMT